MTHTLEPWELYPHGGYPTQDTITSYIIHVGDPDESDNIVAEVHGPDDATPEELKGNALLMRAAQDLLKTLDDILESLRNAPCCSEHCHGGTCHICATRRKARAAIAKAKEMGQGGEQNG